MDAFSFTLMVANLSLSDEDEAPFSEPATDAIESLDNLIGIAREIRPADRSQGQPIQTQDYDGGVQVYYALPVEAGATGVFEHVSSWPNRQDAESEITALVAADARRQELAADAREALAAWAEACDGPSADDEHAAAVEVAGVLAALLAALQESSLI